MRRNTREFSLLYLCLCLSVSLLHPHPVRSQGEAKLGRLSPYQNMILWHPDLGYPAPKLWRYTFLLFISLGLWYSLQQSKITSSRALNLFWKCKNLSEWKEIETDFSILKNLWDFTKLILFFVCLFVCLTPHLRSLCLLWPRECIIIKSGWCSLLV